MESVWWGRDSNLPFCAVTKWRVTKWYFDKTIKAMGDIGTRYKNRD